MRESTGLFLVFLGISFAGEICMCFSISVLAPCNLASPEASRQYHLSCNAKVALDFHFHYNTFRKKHLDFSFCYHTSPFVTILHL